MSTADYLQPFPSVVIELPADYTRKRVVPFEEGSHAPDFVIVRHEPEAGCVLVTMHLTSHQVLTRLLKLDPAWTLEEMWEKGKRTWDARDTLGMTPEEAALGSALSKLALNVCLMATAYGVRVPGACQPVALRAAEAVCEAGPQAWAGAAGEGRHGSTADAGAVRLRPGGHAVPAGAGRRITHEAMAAGGWTVSPHWRRGHWRSQPCGAGRSGAAAGGHPRWASTCPTTSTLSSTPSAGAMPSSADVKNIQAPFRSGIDTEDGWPRLFAFEEAP